MLYGWIIIIVAVVGIGFFVFFCLKPPKPPGYKYIAVPAFTKA